METLACEIRSPIESRIRANRDTGRVTTESLSSPKSLPSTPLLLYYYSCQRILQKTFSGEHLSAPLCVKQPTGIGYLE